MESVWSADTKDTHIKQRQLAGSIKTDVLVIGGGMAGILTAFRLKEAGVDCIVAEAKNIGDGVTGNTTAKITAQHGLIYHKIIKRFGIEKARLYFEANQQAIKDFLILSERYPCDFEETEAYVYSTGHASIIEQEAKAYQQLGIPTNVMRNLPIPVNVTNALSMEKQAQFHPLKLLHALSNELSIYENTFIHRIEGQKAITTRGSIEAKHIVMATHYPLVNIPGLYFMKLYQHRSYVIALEKAPCVHGIYVDERETGLSFRNYKDLLLIGGGDHKTGKEGGGYDELRRLAQSAYPDSIEKYHWATQDCMSLHGIPYIGRHSAGKHHRYVATGFNKWGMTHAMVASRLICDLIVNRKNEYESLYSARRSVLTKQLALNIGSAAAGLLSMGGMRCSHMGCKLKWNPMERTWDCPCHGSQFDHQGNILNNPAKKEINP